MLKITNVGISYQQFAEWIEPVVFIGFAYFRQKLLVPSVGVYSSRVAGYRPFSYEVVRSRRKQ